MIKAPDVTSLRVDKLAANYINIKWDSVGGNFYYLVYRRLVDDVNAELDPDYDWGLPVSTTTDTNFFDRNVIPNYSYQYMIRTTYKTFEMSDGTVSDVFKTFPTNAYVFTKMNQLTLSDEFIQEKFVKNNQRYVDFNNDTLFAGLMGEDFTFYKEYNNVSQVLNKFVTDPERHEVQGFVPAICNEKSRLMISKIDDVLYLFERFQHAIKVSNDKGKTWIYYSAFNGRIGNPIANQCTYQSRTTSFVLGYNEIFFGRPSTDTRWSDDQVRFNNLTQVTFAKLGDDTEIGFPVEIFGKYIDLPAVLNKRSEAMACSDNYLYVAGRNVIYRADLVKPVITEHGRQWDNTTGYRITPDPENRTITTKLDVLGDKVYALVTGQVKKLGDDPTNPANVVPSEYDGIYILNDEDMTWTRIFGTTEEERSHIRHKETNMSTDGVEIFFDYFNNMIPTMVDEKLPDCFPDIPDINGLRYSEMTSYPSDKKKHIITYRTKDTEFKAGPSSYHGESQFVWSKRNKSRAWISPSYKAIVVYPETRYQHVIDEDKLITQEVNNDGSITINMDNIKFDGFTNYANGILIYKINSEESGGEIVGYYEFNYRVRDEVELIWKPEHVMLSAELVNQERPVTDDGIIYNGLVDPDISPLLNKMAPESYMQDGGLFKLFSENYLKYLSTGKYSYYNNLKNLIRNKYPREEDNFEHLYSEINKRNIYLDKEKRDQVVRFFEARNSDFYSTKGVVESYKFLFKLLYNADVELEVESMNTLEYDVVVESGLVTEDIVGTTVYTPTGRANITYIEREYENGKLRWRLTIHNLYGRFEVGQVMKSEVFPSFNAKILVGVRGKELSYSDIDYINRGRVYYTMKIKSEIPLTRYRDDILRFVHPVGFGFIGVTLITVLINSGFRFVHNETIINVMKTYRWDAGLPNVFPDQTYMLDSSGNIVFDTVVTGKARKTAHPLAGKDPLVLFADKWKDYDKQPEMHGQKPSERRKQLSPTFEGATVTYAMYSMLEGKRLKDHIGLPRDSDKLAVNPQPATQIKVGKCQQSIDQ